LSDKRVNITYAVDLDEVPSRVAHLLREALEQFENVCNDIHNATNRLDSGQSTVKTCRSIDEVRQRLMKLDVRLEDCQALLAGYQKTVSELSQPLVVEKLEEEE